MKKVPISTRRRLFHQLQIVGFASPSVLYLSLSLSLSLSLWFAVQSRERALYISGVFLVLNLFVSS